MIQYDKRSWIFPLIARMWSFKKKSSNKKKVHSKKDIEFDNPPFFHFQVLLQASHFGATKRPTAGVSLWVQFSPIWMDLRHNFMQGLALSLSHWCTYPLKRYVSAISTYFKGTRPFSKTFVYTESPVTCFSLLLCKYKDFSPPLVFLN